ncbi:hypothetical protein QTO34_005492, partial [Cnephaeus nilssonii]
MSCGGSWAVAVFCLWGTDGHAGPWVTFSPLPTPAPAQEAEAAPPDAELEAPPPPELSPPPAASPAAAVEPGPAPEETEAPAPLDGEPSLEPMLAPASEEELPVELAIQGPLVKWAHPVRCQALRPLPPGRRAVPGFPPASVCHMRPVEAHRAGLARWKLNPVVGKLRLSSHMQLCGPLRSQAGRVGKTGSLARCNVYGVILVSGKAPAQPSPASPAPLSAADTEHRDAVNRDPASGGLEEEQEL